MIQDIWVVAAQEWRSIRRSFLPTTRAMLTVGAVLVLFGVVVPFGIAGGWLNSATFLFLWFWLVWLQIAGPISDSFAGEHERRTLDALFATRLPDAAILLGKIIAVMCMGWLLTWLALLAAAVVSTLFSGIPSMAPSCRVCLTISTLLTPSVALFASATGALLSLTAQSARQAHQMTIAVVPVIAVVALAADWLLRGLAPAMSEPIDRRLLALVQEHMQTPLTWLSVTAVILVGAAFAAAAAAHRLHRARVVPA